MKGCNCCHSSILNTNKIHFQCHQGRILMLEFFYQIFISIYILFAISHIYAIPNIIYYEALYSSFCLLFKYIIIKK